MPSADRIFPRHPRVRPHEVTGALKAGVVAGPGGVMITVDHATAQFLLSAVAADAEHHEARVHESADLTHPGYAVEASHRLRAVQEAMTEALTQLQESR